MTEEQVNNTPILEFINRPDFNSLNVTNIEWKSYWEITFLGKQLDNGGLYEWEGSKSPFKYFKIYKPKNQ